MKMREQEKLRSILSDSYTKRKAQNPQYSLRAFARDLSLESSHLSKILSGKRRITPDLAMRIGDKWKAGPENESKAFQEFALAHGGIKPRLSSLTEREVAKLEWYHFAILELFTIPRLAVCEETVSERLGISRGQAHNGLKILSALGQIKPAAGGWILHSKNNTTTGIKMSSKHLRKIQADFLKRSMEALQKIPFEQRDHSGLTVAIPAKKIAEAKELIKSFRRKFLAVMQSDDVGRDTVYQLCISFFPLNKN